MKIPVRALDFHFDECDTAQGVRYRRAITTVLRPIGDDYYIGFEQLRVHFDKLRQAFRAGLFFTFNQHFDIDRKFLTGFFISLNSLNMRPELPFVIGGASGDNIPVLDYRIERRAFPQFQRLLRLDVIMPVIKNRQLVR